MICIICGRPVAACVDPYILWLLAFPNQMTYLSYSAQVHHSAVPGPSTNKVISVLLGCRVLGGKHTEGKGKVGRWVRAEGCINMNWCKKCGRSTGLGGVTPLQRTSVKQLKERGGDRGENAGIERNNSQGGGEESKGGKASERCVSLAPWREQSISNWSSSSAQQGILNQSQIDLCARGRENLQWSLSEI